MQLFQLGWDAGMWIELVLLGGAAASVWLFRGRTVGERRGEARSSCPLALALAVIGALALIVLAAMVLTHYGMMR